MFTNIEFKSPNFRTQKIKKILNHGQVVLKIIQVWFNIKRSVNII